MVSSNIEPAEVLKYFKEICSIPHGSGNEEQLAEHIFQFAQNRSLWVKKDSTNNVIIKKTGTVNKEHLSPIILQSHIDMVCEKNKETIHDFKKDALILQIKDDFLKAKGTTLGADNGVAAAMMLAILDMENIAHPPIECVFTTEEEVGLKGAFALDYSCIEGKRLINLDTEEEGVFVTSCAGGVRATSSFKIENSVISDGYTHFLIGIKGLLGGHSGMDINKERANSIKLFFRAYNYLLEKFDIHLYNVNGGAQDNAIPRECEGYVAVKTSEIAAFLKEISYIENIYKKELSTNESTITLEATKTQVASNKVFTKDMAKKLVTYIFSIPNGVQSTNLNISGLVETSSNIGVIRTNNENVLITSALRSSVSSKKTFMLEQIKLISSMLGGAVSTAGDYPGWEYTPLSPLRDTIVQVYKDQYNETPHLTAIHAGLECGVFCEKIEDLDIISMGPNIFGAHTPEEMLSISSLQRTWEFLLSILKIL